MDVLNKSSRQVSFRLRPATPVLGTLGHHMNNLPPLVCAPHIFSCSSLHLAGDVPRCPGDRPAARRAGWRGSSSECPLYRRLHGGSSGCGLSSLPSMPLFLIDGREPTKEMDCFKVLLLQAFGLQVMTSPLRRRLAMFRLSSFQQSPWFKY